MKKLVFGVGAALLAQGVMADDLYVWNKTDCNLSTYEYVTGNEYIIGSCNDPLIPSTYYLGGNLTAPIKTLIATSLGQTGKGSVAEFDLGGYTLKPNGSSFSFYSNNGTVSPSTINVKNGTIDGSERAAGSGTFYQGSDGGFMTSATFDNVTIQNFAYMQLLANVMDSSVTFKNKSKIKVSEELTCFTGTKTFDDRDVVTFEGGTVVTCKTFRVAYSPRAEEGAPTYWDKQVIVRGAGTSINALAADGGYGSFVFGSKLSGASMLVDDHASFYANTWPTVGSEATRCTLTLDNGASWESHSIYIGSSGYSNNRMIVKNGAKVSCLGGDYICVGRASDNNTLILSNADVSATGAIVIGGEWHSADTNPESIPVTAGNAVYICGETKLPAYNGTHAYNQFPTFYNSDGLVCFRGYTNTTTWAGETLEIPRGSQPQTRDHNEIRFEEGSNVSLNWINVDAGHAGTKITVKDSTLFVKSKFDDYGTGTILELDNGQMTLDGSNPWNFYFNQSEDGGGAMCIFKGDHPQLWNKTAKHETYGAGQVQFWTKTEELMTIQIYLPEDANYQKPLIRSGYISLKGVGTIDIPNLEEVRKELVGTVDIPLAYADETIVNPPESVVLPEGCSLVEGTDGTAKTLSIRINGEGVAKPGAVLIIK